jgi:penicillin-binding protein-related factor A (putative recombinase)
MELPIYSVEINDADDGIEFVALTSNPAIQVNFLKFNNPLKFSTNDEKRIISGPIMLADTPLYRRDTKFGEYYVVYSPETIEVMATKMLFDKRTTAVNIEHIDGSAVNGVILQELYIKNSARGIAPAEFNDVPEGSLFATYKVENQAI